MYGRKPVGTCSVTFHTAIILACLQSGRVRTNFFAPFQKPFCNQPFRVLSTIPVLHDTAVQLKRKQHTCIQIILIGGKVLSQSVSQLPIEISLRHRECLEQLCSTVHPGSRITVFIRIAFSPFLQPLSANAIVCSKLPNMIAGRRNRFI